MTSTSTTSKFKTLRRGGATTECGGHDESLFRTGFFKISVLASKRHLTWAVARALFIITQQEATCSMCVNCVNLLLSAPENSMSPQARSPAPENSMSPQARSPICAAFHPSWIDFQILESLLLLQSYKCLLMVWRMSKAGCFLLSFRTLQPKRVSTKCFSR